MRNKWEQSGAVVSIYITRRNGDRHTVLIDADDLDLAARHTWHVIPDSLRHYAATMSADEQGVQRHVLLHRLILDGEIPDGHEVTFRNGNPLDCRRSNLLTTTHLEIAQGKASTFLPASNLRSIFTHQNGKPYVSLIVRGKHFLHYCDTVAEAIDWRDSTLAKHGLRLEGLRRVAI